MTPTSHKKILPFKCVAQSLFSTATEPYNHCKINPTAFSWHQTLAEATTPHLENFFLVILSNNVARNRPGEVFVWTCVFSSIGLLGHVAIWAYHFKELPHNFSNLFQVWSGLQVMTCIQWLMLLTWLSLLVLIEHGEYSDPSPFKNWIISSFLSSSSSYVSCMWIPSKTCGLQIFSLLWIMFLFFGCFETGSFVIPPGANFKLLIIFPQTAESGDCGGVTPHLGLCSCSWWYLSSKTF